MNWKGEMCVILASGPSLTAAQCEHVREWKKDGGRVIAINTTWESAPWADVLYACDWAWWKHHYIGVRERFRGALWSQDMQARDNYRVNWIRSERGVGLCRNPEVIYQGGGMHSSGNGGYQAINLAYHWGVKRFVLLGFDMQKVGGKSHHHRPHVLNVDSPYESWRRAMPYLARDLTMSGVEVINATPESALTCFSTASLEDALACAVPTA